MANETKIPLFRRFVIQNFPYIEQDFDALTDYQLISKIVEYLNQVITSQNNLVDDMNDLETAFNTLKDYVDHYFDNLDVQEEINNKLDEMAEDGTLQEIITTYLQSNVAWTFDTVADMKVATNLVAGSYARTLGFHSVNDGGGSTYYISDTGTANEKDIIAVGSNLLANLVVSAVVTPEMYGAYGDDTHDDTPIFTYMLTKVDKITTLNKTYLLSSQLVLTEGKEISGAKDSLGYTKFNAVTGIKIAGRKITLQNVELIGTEQANYGLYCCGNNEGGSTPGANHFSQNIIRNVILNNYNYGIYFNAVVWNNTFENMRINFCNYGLFNTSTYYIMTTIFENIYFSGCVEYDVNLKKSNTQFNYCNFGISSHHPLQFAQNCNLIFNNCNFECDKYITGTGAIFELTGKSAIINGCMFKMCCASTMSLFNTGAGVQNLELNNNNYESVTLDSPNALVKIFNDGISGAVYGCINIGNGNNDIPFNIETSDRIPYGKYLFVRWHNLIQTYSEVSDLTKLSKGDMIYFYQTNTIKFYNGTSLVEM